MRSPILCLLVSLLVGGLTPALAAGGTPVSVSVAANVGEAQIVFSRDEIRIIRDYFESGAHAGKGRGKAKGLPPGIAKNLARGKPLPPGIAKQALPDDLLGRLPRPPAGHDRIVVAGKVLLVEIATQIVRDILEDIVY